MTLQSLPYQCSSCTSGGPAGTKRLDAAYLDWRGETHFGGSTDGFEEPGGVRGDECRPEPLNTGVPEQGRISEPVATGAGIQH